jgi:hypothetical protein
MRTVKWNSFLPCLLALGVMTASARADVTTEEGASILIFPKLIVEGSSDTVIQITNISNDLVFARCFYVNAQLTIPEVPEHPILNPPLWLETDFNIRLTRQQPTHWLVSIGRPVDPFDMCDSGPACIPPVNLNGLGIDPGAVPPVVEDFVGELKCVEVDASGTPIGGNHLKGEATIVTEDGEVSKYNAVGIQGTDLAGATGNDLQLNNPSGESSGQYNACPNELILNHFAEGANDEDGLRPLNLPGDSVTTEITFVPCQQDFENQIPGTVTLQFKIYNEFEVPFSTSTTVTCWKNINLEDIGNTNVFDIAVLGSDVAQTFIRPADGTDGAVVAVAEEFHSEEGDISRAAFNVHSRGDRLNTPDGFTFDHIVLPDVE